MQSSVELTQQLVRFKTINPPGDESACAESLATLLEGAGFVVNVVPFGDGRAQLIAKSAAYRENCQSDSPAISILYHSERSPGPSIRSPPKWWTASSMAAARPI